jgi:hypothetical protein
MKLSFKNAILLLLGVTSFIAQKGVAQTIENWKIQPDFNLSPYQFNPDLATINQLDISQDTPLNIILKPQQLREIAFLGEINLPDLNDSDISQLASDLQFQAQINPEDNQELIEKTPPTLENSEDSNFDNESAEIESSGGASLVEKLQNPLASLISIPFQNNTNFGVGELDSTQNILNIQPVIPIDLNDNWLLVSRTIFPIVYQPALTQTQSSHFGLGDINPQLFFIPKTDGKITWGVGPVFLLPTATDDSLGTGKWGIGPTAAIVVTDAPWVMGALANNIWSVAGDSDRPDVSQFLLQPFINYNLANGWYLVSAPIITANWNASSGNKWTIPIGGGFGRLFNIGKQPINATLQAYWNVETPEGGADWTLRTQFQFLFSTGD